MYVSLRWMEYLLGLQDLSLSSFTERLTLGGFEIESIQAKQYNFCFDIILDISFTANRSDLTNIKNLFFELHSLFAQELPYQKPLNIRALVLKQSNKKEKLLFPFQSFLKGNKTSRFLLQNSNNIKTVLQLKTFFVKYYVWETVLQKKLSFVNDITNDYYIPYCQQKSNNFRITDSPKWIQNRLLLMNFTPINNIIDTVNYILIETGQVFFVYDSLRLENFTNSEHLNFVAKFSEKSDRFLLSKSQDILLNPNLLTLRINNKIVSLFGFIQNFHTIVTNNTSEFVLQGGIFDSKQIKEISKFLGIRTEYSIKLEKQNDLNLLEQAYLRLLYLYKVQGINFFKSSFEKSNRVKSTSLISYYVKKYQSRISVFYKNIDRLIGPYKFKDGLKSFELLKNLRFLNFKIYFITNTNFIIKAPLQRQLDIEEEVDIIEEIVRIVGFNSFESILPLKNPLGKLTKLEKFKRYIKNALLNLGMSESIHSTFSKKTFLLESPLQNPLFTESSTLRVSLLNSLIDKILFNKNLICNNFEMFEFGRIYKYLNTIKYSKKEMELVSGILGGKLFRSNWEEGYSTINWFEAKGILENIFEQLNISTIWKPAQFEFETFYHPTRTANIIVNSQFIGTFGQVHPNLVLKEGIDKELYLFEFNVEILNKLWKNKTTIKFSPYSVYSMSYLDLTCICKKDKVLSFLQIKDTILSIGQPLLKSVDLSDYYCKPPIKAGFYSLTFKLGFTLIEGTLLTSSLNEIIERIKNILKTSFDIKIH